MGTTILLDGEEVHLKGSYPSTIDALLHAIEGHLRLENKRVGRVIIDGDHGAIFSTLGHDPKQFREIQIKAKPLGDHGKVQAYLERLQEALLQLKRTLLMCDFEKILELSRHLLQHVDAFLSTFKEYFILLYASLNTLYIQWVQTWMASLEQKDVGTLYDLLHHSLLPLVHETESHLNVTH